MFQASTSSSFGQSPFGNPATTGFSAPVFRSTTNTNLFGGATIQQSGLFGSSTTTPNFGPTQTTLPAFGGFTSTSSGTGLFGNQQNASSGLFGASTTSAFGQPKPGFGGFGTQQQAGGSFQQAQSQQLSLFGQPATQSPSRVFGCTPGFGTTGTTIQGTTAKFIPATGIDTMIKNGVCASINARRRCITCMEEYEGKSLEELRYEDYLANRKGPQPGLQNTGLFGVTNQAPLFSTNTSPVTTASNLFGTENKSLFVATTQGFGAGNINVLGAGTSSNTLFGKPAANVTAFQTPASNTANTFGFNTNTSLNPFGAAQKPLATTAQTSLFGNTSQPSTVFGSSGGLGTFTSQSNQNGGLFGQNKVTKPLNFGSNQPTNTLGGGLGLGGGSSLFGSTSKPGGLSTQTSTGLFSGGLGTTNTFTGSNSLGGLGSQPLNLRGGIYFNQNANLGNQSGQFNNPFNQHLWLYASKPFGDSPLFKNVLAPKGKADELIKQSSPATQKAVMSGQNYKVSTKNSTKIKVKPVESNSAAKKSVFDGLNEEEEARNKVLCQAIRPSPKRLILKPRSFSNVPIIQRSTVPRIWNFINVMSPVIKTSSKIKLRSSLTKDNTFGKHSTTYGTNKIPLPSRTSTQKGKSPCNTLFELSTNIECLSLQEDGNPGNSENKEILFAFSDSDMKDTEAHPTGIVLRRHGYYTIPSLDELTDLMDNEGRCIVDNFTVGRLNFGNIFYPDPFDVAGLNLDEIVHFRHKEVVVYPDDERKPQIGKDLNRRAQVTLDRVWPMDKITRRPINDPSRLSLLNYENKLIRANAKHGTTFLEYRPQTGSWVFKVDHF